MEKPKIRCYGNFTDDRICDLCSASCPDINSECKKETEKRKTFFKVLFDFISQCPHSEYLYQHDSIQKYLACKNKPCDSWGNYGACDMADCHLFQAFWTQQINNV